MTIRIDIETREPASAKEGATAYEILRGRVFGELDPRDPRDAIITDIAAAPVNANGLVEYSATFAIAKPMDMKQASGVLLYDAPNRGMGWMGIGPDGRVRRNWMEADADGHIRVVSGWQGDISPGPGLQTASVPVARGPKGESLTGPVLVRFADMAAGAATLPIVDGLAYPVPRPLPVSLDTYRAQLLRLQADDLPSIPVASDDWTFGDCTATPFPGNPDPTKISLRGGFDPTHTYVLVYEAKDPQILGIGFAATRDLNAFLRYGAADHAGKPNPLAGSIKWTIASGVSQAGNFLRSFLHLGFNADKSGRIVFDGMNTHIAPRQLPLNVRFGLAGGAANLYELGSEGTLWWTRYLDGARGRGVTSQQNLPQNNGDLWVGRNLGPADVVQSGRDRCQSRSAAAGQYPPLLLSRCHPLRLLCGRFFAGGRPFLAEPAEMLPRRQSESRDRDNAGGGADAGRLGKGRNGTAGLVLPDPGRGRSG
jgi:hypothetical protein